MVDRMLRWPEVHALVRLGRTTVWEMERAGRFPRRRSLGGFMVAWVESEVQEWIASRPVVALTPPEGVRPQARTARTGADR